MIKFPPPPLHRQKIALLGERPPKDGQPCRVPTSAVSLCGLGSLLRTISDLLLHPPSFLDAQLSRTFGYFPGLFPGFPAAREPSPFGFTGSGRIVYSGGTFSFPTFSTSLPLAIPDNFAWRHSSTSQFCDASRPTSEASPFVTTTSRRPPL